MLDGRPVYRFHYGADQLVAYADSGESIHAAGEIEAEQALRIASAWTGQPAHTAEFQGLLDEADQWTLSGYAALRPLYQYRWPDGEVAYVSQATGRSGAAHHAELAVLGIPGRYSALAVLRAAAQEPGAMVRHRGVVVGNRHGDDTVRDRGRNLALFAIGTTVPISRKAVRNKACARETLAAVVSPEGPSSIPYSGQKRWHTMLGLIFGLFACTWTFSGMLSMGPFAWLGGGGSLDLQERLRGTEWRPEAFAAEHPRKRWHA